MALKCPACKYNNADGALVCNLCGEKLASQAEIAVDLSGLAAPAAPGGRAGGGQDLWIHCPPFNPLPLPRDRKFTIGRSSSNDLVLPVAMVSRNHATIVFDKGRFLLTDLDSSNGCYVNGERVQQRELKAGDRLKIDPYHMEVLGKDPRAVEQQADMAEQTLNISRSELLGAQTGISGKLQEMSLADVVQLLGQQRKSGSLKIRSGPGRGTEAGVIYLVSGEVVDARCGDRTGEDAFYKLAELEDGTFKFANEEARGNRTIVRKTPNLLMEAMRLKDERKR
jgi:pSer/pThr/pTyr-binding forkhead associated (FHA) protein